jgi:hypothetical protein
MGAMPKFFLSPTALNHRRSKSSLEKLISRCTRRTLLLHICLEPVDFVVQQLHAQTKLFYGEQREILPNIVHDFLLRFVVLVDRRHFNLPDLLSFRAWAVRNDDTKNLAMTAPVVTSPAPA